MLACTLQRYRCTLAEVRQDYWLGRAWRALAGDPDLAGRVARLGFDHILLTGPGYGPMLPSAREREAWRQRVIDRLAADTGHDLDSLGLTIHFAESRVTIGEGCMLSLLAQTVARDPRWHQIDRFAADLEAVIVPVAHAAESSAAA